MTPLLLLISALGEVPAAPPSKPDEDGPYSYPRHVRMFVLGVGRAAGDCCHLTTAADVGFNPFNGAVGTGVSTSLAIDQHFNWGIVSPGVYLEIDLTYVLLTALWTLGVQSTFPFRVQVGSRVSADVSGSQTTLLDYKTIYWLVRPSLHTFLDLEIPWGRSRHWAATLRLSVDTSVNLSAVFRGQLELGFTFGYPE